MCVLDLDTHAHGSQRTFCADELTPYPQPPRPPPPSTRTPTHLQVPYSKIQELTARHHISVSRGGRMGRGRGRGDRGKGARAALPPAFAVLPPHLCCNLTLPTPRRPHACVLPTPLPVCVCVPSLQREDILECVSEYERIALWNVSNDAQGNPVLHLQVTYRQPTPTACQPPNCTEQPPPPHPLCLLRVCVCGFGRAEVGVGSWRADGRYRAFIAPRGMGWGREGGPRLRAEA